MRRTIASIVTLWALTSLSACSFIARGEDQYREDTRALLETKSPGIKACYDRSRESKPVSQEVMVHFTVKKKTGALTNVDVDAPRSSSSAELQACVQSSLEDLTLTPGDRRDGRATFTWVYGAAEGRGM